jgi:hypothetical protein
VLDVEAKTSKDPLTGIKTVIGNEPPTFDEIVFELAVAGDYQFIAHTSYSHHDPAILPAGVLHERYRIVFALSRPLVRIDAKTHEVKLLAHHVAGMLGLSDCVDTACMEPARLYFMPRCPADRSEQFRHEAFEGALLDVDALLNEIRRDVAALTQAKAKQQRDSNKPSVIDAFNATYSPGDILEGNGYISKRGNRWMHPNSTTGMPGVRLLPNSTPERIYSSHSNDPLNDTHAHDAFDCYCILEHGGEFKSAVRAAARLLGMDSKPKEAPQRDYSGLLSCGNASASQQTNEEPNVPQGRFKVLSADDICNAPPLEWLIKGVIPKHGTGVVFGASGSGKSFFVLDACCAIAGDAELFYGYRVKHAPVVYVSLEGQAGLGNRLNAWKTHHAKTIPNALKFIIEPFNLLTDDVPALADSVIRAGGDEGTLIVIDTLNRATTGTNENDSKDMGLIISATSELQRLTGGLVCLVHHAGKNLSAGMRGHSSLHGALDAAIEVSRDADRRKWTIAKAKDGADGVTHPFKLELLQIGIDTDEDLITSCVAVPDDTPAPEKEVKPSVKNKLPASAKLGMAALQWAISHKGIATPPEVLAETGAGNIVEVEFVADLADWRERFKNTAGEVDANAERQAFARAKKWLVENDKISILSKWVFEKRQAVTF